MEDEIKSLLTKENKFHEHYEAQKLHPNIYKAVLILLINQGVEITIGNKARILAAAWARHDVSLADYLINGLRDMKKSKHNYIFGLVEILKALTLLDSRRRIRALEKKLQRFEHEGTAKSKTTGPIKAQLNDLKQEGMKVGSVSGALAGYIGKWTASLSPDTLEFYAINFPKEPWQELANICHLSTKDFQLNWFLDYVFGQSPPEGTIVSECSDLCGNTEEKVNELFVKWKLPYSFIRRQFSPQETTTTPSSSFGFNRRRPTRGRGRGRRGRGMRGGRGRGGMGRGRGQPVAPVATVGDAAEPNTSETKEEVEVAPRLTSLTPKLRATISTYESLDTLLWYHEELECDAVNLRIGERLASGEEPSFTYGKLMERLLYAEGRKLPFFKSLIPICEKRLRDISLTLEPPVVVVGDASSSMDVAIRTATIISALLTVLANADLRFFNGNNFLPPLIPKNIEEVLKVAKEVRASGCTSPAASLWDSYAKKEKVNFFVMVTDEEENTDSNGYRFSKLFKKYLDEVHSESKLLFISFLHGSNQKGMMIRELEELEIVPLQFRLDQRRPDLTKIDTLLGMLSASSSDFNEQAREMADKLEKGETLVIQGALGGETKFTSKKPDTVNVTFSIHYKVEKGESLHLVGSAAELGKWNWKQSQKMSWTEGDYWTLELTLQASQLPFEYKYAVVNPQTKNVRWENDPNRIFSKPTDHCFDKWQ